MTKLHYVWGKPKPSQLDPGQPDNRSRLYHDGTIIYLEGEHVDHEDNRTYENSGTFKLSDFREAVQKLQETDEVQIENEANGCKLTLKRQAHNSIVLKLDGDTFPGSTLGGASIRSTACFSTTLEQLQTA